MRSLDLFAGAGGSLYAGLLLGWRCVAAVEIDGFCRRVLEARQADGIFEPFDLFADVRDFDGRPWRGRVDVVTAGFPCQPFSTAGLQRGADDERNMWPETSRIIREVRPRFVFLENVASILTSGYFGTVAGDMVASGYDLAWACFRACDSGAPHVRSRLFVVGRLSDAGSRRIIKDGISDPRGGDDSSARVEDAYRRRKASDGRQAVGARPDVSDAERERLRNESRRIGGERREGPTFPSDHGAPGSLADADRERFEERHRAAFASGSQGAGSCLSRGWWRIDPADREGSAASQSVVGRVAYGLASGVNRSRLAALGNGWVPSVAYRAWHHLRRQFDT